MSKMAIWSLLLTFLLISACTAWEGERPILQSRDGNLEISSAKDRNITLLANGKSAININGINLIEVTEHAREAARLVAGWKNGNLDGLMNDINRIINIVERHPDGLEYRMNEMELRLNNVTSLSPSGSRDYQPSESVPRLNTRFRDLERTVQRITTNLETNSCLGDPCKNGGTCIRIYGGFQCLCPSNYEGPNCADDVNECIRYANTDLGCQNGATCRNLIGSYRCECAPGWHGIHCISKASACDAQDSRELCGHGDCVPNKSTPLGYTCRCDQGWQSEGTDPACRKDVDECAGNHPPCSVNPMVQCVNYPGGYACGSCPAGYTGTGYYCVDIDECLVNNGGCSVVPNVQCINTMGSRICGHCPPGYQGDGTTCTYVGACKINNGGCHPLATCIENTGSTNLIVQCNCPAGYHGNGMGPQGCQPGYDSINPCASNPCAHGTCERNGILYICRCHPGYTGTQCENHVNSCTPNPCQNEGICQSTGYQTFTCKCTDKFSGPRCENERQSCGGSFSNPSGSITYPLEGQLYDSNLDCAFIIHTNNASTVLNITFTRFDFEQTAHCHHDFLEIHDGPNLDASLLKRACGTQLPLGGTFTTNHNSLYLYLRTDKSTSHRGFSLNWESVKPKCGGTLNSPFGTIKSPGSPGNYPHDRDCFWFIHARPGKRIQFHFVMMQMEPHPTCDHDYLEINETTGDRDKQLDIYCNHTNPDPIFTSGSYAKLHFHSDSAGSDLGFILSYSSVEGTPGCGGEFTGDSGIITSPGFPSNYPTDIICEYKIRLPKNEKIHLTWMDFEMEQHRFCRWDYVKIFNGSNLDAPLISTHCGNTLPGPMSVHNNVALIVFRSDWTNAFKGFRLKYQAMCGGTFHAESGELKSPYYPSNYPAARVCIYEIIQPPGRGIIFEMIDMAIETSWRRDCGFDSLAIYDGDNENSTRLGLLCGRISRRTQRRFLSTHNYMYLKFETDAYTQNRGFYGNYTTYDRGCGGLLKEPSGVIQSPTAARVSFRDGPGCTWIIRAPKGHVVKLTFSSFSKNRFASCSTDNVKVFEGAGDGSQLINKYCGPDIPTETPLTQGDTMTITIATRSIDFAAHYITIDVSKTCGGHYTTPTGSIMSPNYPNNYPSNRICVWIITAPEYHQINLEVLSFDLDNRTIWNSADYLEVRNGKYESSPLIDTYRGTNMPRNLKSFTNQLYLKFVSGSRFERSGFNIKWDSSTEGCGGDLNGFSGQIASPNYPQTYPYRASCTWKITVGLGSKVRITILDIDLSSDKCEWEYVKITTGADQRKKTGKKYCNQNHPTFIEVDSNVATIQLRTGWTGTGRGFLMKYETDCVNTIRGFYGVIESPNYPNPYPDSANCTWTIEAPKGNTVNITFFELELAGDLRTNTCPDYLDIREGSRGVADTEIKKLCGSTDISKVIPTKQRQAFLHFVTDEYRNAKGFRLEWATVGCGGYLVRPTGVIKSPGYPQASLIDIECEWLIEVEFGHSVEITFTDINIEKRAGCDKNKVILYGGVDANAPKLKELCYSTSPVIVTSPTNKLFIKFESDRSAAGHGFNAKYETVQLTCGGKFRGDTGFIHTAHYPQNYADNSNCEWLIEVDKNHVVNLTFTDFDVDGSANCTADYVKVFDGPTTSALEYGPFCNRKMPPSIISSGNSILVVLKTNTYITAKGFKAQYSKACGAHIIADSDGTLETSSLLHMENAIINCTWIVTAKDDADHVTLSFFHMDLTNYYQWQENCTGRFLSVYEGDGVDGPSRGKWCGTKTPLPITSTGRSLTVHLYSAVGSADVRFGATYSVLNSACGGEHFSVSGTIASPTYPNSYPINVECIWILKTSPGTGITLTFSEFELESDLHCDRDYLEIRENSGAGKLIDTFCGSIPGPINSPTNLWIKFKSDDRVTAKGFLAEYAIMHNNELTGTKGEITSPLYPHPWYSDDSITWRITVYPGMAVRVEFYDVHFEGFGGCASRLTFHSGSSKDTPILKEICHSSIPTEPITSTSNVLFISLSTDHFREGNWFHLHWYQIPRSRHTSGTIVTKLSDCEVEYDLTSVNSTSVTFSSPGFPNGYARNLRCTWVFTSPPGYHLSLSFHNLHLEEHMGCNADYVSIFNGNGLSTEIDPSTTLKKVCLSNATIGSTKGKDVMTVKFHSDGWYNGTGFNATVKRVCGGELRGPNGVIDFNETMTMSPGVSWACEWNITVRNGKTIKIKFTDFAVANIESPVCSIYNYVMLRNGHEPGSPLLGSGRFCNSSLPPDNLETTGNKLYVRVRGMRPRMNFKMTYSEKGIGCGGSFQLTENNRLMEFSSPNYPNIPPPYSECFWTYMAPPGERLTLHFIDRFDLTASKDCTKEYVEVRDGGTENARLVDRYCRDTAPSSISSTGNMLYIKYFTEYPEPRNGFKAKVTMGLCGGIIRGIKGVIRSPNYPHAFPSNQQCMWTIIAPLGHSLKLQFTDFDLPGRRHCERSKVEIHQPHSNDTDISRAVESYGPFCGTTAPSAIQTASNEITVSFTSDRSTNFFFHGFSLNFTASRDACGGSLTGVSGELQTVGYPKPLNHFRVCWWNIEVPDGSQVMLEILDLDIPADLVNVVMGSSAVFANDQNYRSVIPFPFKLPYKKKIYSTSNMMEIYSYFSAGRRGIKAKFTAVAPAPCGGIINDAKGALFPPDSQYNTTSYYCKWTLKVPESIMDPQNRTGVTLVVSITGVLGTYYPRGSKYCGRSHNHITVNDGVQKVQTVCGNITGDPFIVLSPEPFNIIEALNGTYGENMTFDLKYEWNACGGILTGPSHTISPPRNVTYPIYCVWYAKYDDPSAVIFMKFNRLNLGSCDKGHIIVRNGGRMGPEMHKFCGNVIDHNITSSMNELWIEYFAAQAPGDFEFQLDSTSGSCGGTYRGTNKELSTPNFPKSYPNNAECTWEITADPGFTVGLYFVDRFSMETSDNCANDFVQTFDWVYDKHGVGTWKDNPKYCGRNTPTPLNSTSNRMKILFRSNGAKQDDGFRAKWEQNCGGRYEAKAYDQYISSPHYPREYSPNTICTYTISAPEGEVAWVEFLDFELEDMTRKCKHDRVTTFSDYGYSRERREWCGKDMPTIVRSFGDIRIKFETDRYVEKRGFRFRYFYNECGGNITEPTAISPPSSKDGRYFGHLNCTWVITAPKGMSVSLRLEKLDIETNWRCSYDKLLVVEGKTLRGKPIIKLCGNVTDPGTIPIKSIGNTMTVQFASDNSWEFGGMSAVIIFSKSEASGCGGRIELQNATAFRTQRTAKYDPLEDCQWTVKVEPGKFIKLTINHMDLKNATNTTSVKRKCTGDFLEIRDGGVTGELLDRYCGNIPPRPIITTTTVLWIRFFSDSTLEGEGVLAWLDPINSPCGKQDWSVTNTSISFASPDYPSDFPAGIRCRWSFTRPTHGYLRLHFEDLNMEDTQRCDGDHLEISDDVDKYSLQDFGQNFVFNGRNTRPMLYGYGILYSGGTYKYCGQASKFDHHSITGTIHVTLKTTSEHMPKPRKFKFDISPTLCNRNYTAEQGRIRHHEIAECWTTITAPPNHTISLYFDRFRFHDRNKCSNSFFKVHYGDFHSPVIKTLCGRSTPDPIFSTGNMIGIHAKSSLGAYMNTQDGYDLTYTTTDKGRGCGGRIYNDMGTFTSPMYPHNYTEASDCLWVIIVPREHQVILDFRFFDLGNSRCEDRYLQITEVKKEGGRSENYCSGPPPANFRATTNVVNVRYVAKNHTSGTGWKINFRADQSPEFKTPNEDWQRPPSNFY